MLKRLFIMLMAGLTMLGTAISANYKEEGNIEEVNYIEYITYVLVDVTDEVSCMINDWEYAIKFDEFYKDADITIVYCTSRYSAPGKLYEGHRGFYVADICMTEYLELCVVVDGFEFKFYVAENNCKDHLNALKEFYKSKDNYINNIINEGR